MRYIRFLHGSVCTPPKPETSAQSEPILYPSGTIVLTISGFKPGAVHRPALISVKTEYPVV